MHAPSSHTPAILAGTQISLEPVSNCKITSCGGEPTVQVAKYPPLAREFSMTSCCVPACRLPKWDFGSCRLDMSHCTTPVAQEVGASSAAATTTPFFTISPGAKIPG